MIEPASHSLSVGGQENRPAIVPRLGIGLNYQGPLRSFIERSERIFDFLEVVPDIVWTDLGPDKDPRYVEDPDGIAFLLQAASEMPLIPHSIGLSIGSAHRCNREHIRQMASWYDRFHFFWHSDHLSYNLIPAGDHEINTGVALPLPYDWEGLDLLSPRVAEVRCRIPVPFLLENNVYYFELPEQELDEADFLNRLCDMTGCRLLLDLHNLYVNSRNHRFDPRAFLDRLDLSNIIEIHVAGGMELDGFYLDAHSGAVPPAVWELLTYTLPQCANLGGVTFELFGSWFKEMGGERLATELAHMKELWMRHQPAPQRRSS